MLAGVTRSTAAAALGSLAILCAMFGASQAGDRPCRDCDIPYQWDDGDAPPLPAIPFPQGFVLTVPLQPGQAPDGQGPVTLNRYAEVAPALSRCLSPHLDPQDAAWHDLTLRVSFKADGAVKGMARVVHMSGPADDEAGRRGRAAMLSALGLCTPLPLSTSLGHAIAGQIFAIRFIQQRTS